MTSRQHYNKIMLNEIMLFKDLLYSNFEIKNISKLQNEVLFYFVVNVIVNSSPLKEFLL